MKSTATKWISPAAGVRAAARSRFSCCVSGWSTSKTVTSASSFIRQARPSRPAPRITSCGDAASRIAASIASVRVAIIRAWRSR